MAGMGQVDFGVSGMSDMSGNGSDRTLTLIPSFGVLSCIGADSSK